MEENAKKWIIAGSGVLGLIIIILIYLNSNLINVIRSYKDVSLALILAYFFLFFLVQVFQTLRWYLIIRSTGKKVNFIKLFWYRLAGYGISYLTPGAQVGGEPVRAALLIKYEKMKGSKAFTTVIADKSLEMTLGFLFLLIGIIILAFTSTLPKAYILAMSIAITLSLALMILFYYKSIKSDGFIYYLFKKLRLDKVKKFKQFEKKLIETETHVKYFFKENKIQFFYAFLISGALTVLMYLEYRIALKLVGIANPSISQIFLIVTLVGLAFAMPIPAALGVLELGQIAIFSFMGITKESGLALTLLIRARDFLFVLWGLILVIIYGVSKSAKDVIEGKE